MSFLGQNAELLDSPIRRKIKAPLGFYGVTSDHKFRVKKVYNMAARGLGCLIVAMKKGNGGSQEKIFL